MSFNFNGRRDLGFDLEDLLIDSEDFEIGNPGLCYLGIFPNTNAKCPSCMYLGTLYFKKYYTYFDLSGYENGQISKPVIVTGLK
jgi:hypothetical protein